MQVRFREIKIMPDQGKKFLTVPKLELQAAVIAARMKTKIAEDGFSNSCCPLHT